MANKKKRKNNQPKTPTQKPKRTALLAEYHGTEVKLPMAAAGAVLAAGLSYLALNAQIADVWLLLSIGIVLLAICAVKLSGTTLFSADFSLPTIWLGAAAAFLLYLISIIGNYLLVSIYPAANEALAALYAFKIGNSDVLLIMLLLFILAPCNEMFWRGFLQRGLMMKVGTIAGWLLTTLLATLISLSAGNLTFTVATLISSLFLGALYFWKRNLAVCVIAAGLWLVGVIVLYPLVLS